MVSRLTFVAVMVEKQTEASSKCILKGKTLSRRSSLQSILTQESQWCFYLILLYVYHNFFLNLSKRPCYFSGEGKVGGGGGWGLRIVILSQFLQ